MMQKKTHQVRLKNVKKRIYMEVQLIDIFYHGTTYRLLIVLTSLVREMTYFLNNYNNETCSLRHFF